MAVEILMPKLGLTMTTGTVVIWLKREGEDVTEKEPVLMIETEKLSYNVESPAQGILIKQLASVGNKYPIATVLGYVGREGEAVPNHISAGSAQTADQTPGAAPELFNEQDPGVRVTISPVAKKLAESAGIDYSRIIGTGPNGRIVKEDVIGFTGSGKKTDFVSSVIPVTAIRQEKPTAAAAVSPSAARNAPGAVIPYAGMRRAVGEAMRPAWDTIPMVTHQISADASAMLEYRKLLNAGISDKSEQITVGELLLKLTASALKDMPIMNASLTGENIVLHGAVHLGMATALDEGLIVPVIHDAANKGLLTISREAKDLAARARAGALLPDDVNGATFTVSNLGGYGSVQFFTPIINPPQAAILGIGCITDTAVPVDGEIRICPMIGLSLTYDHRIIDGATAAQFIALLMKLIKYPARAALAT